MNTKQLRKKYPEAYQDFFGVNEIVYSIPLTVPLRYEDTEYKSGLRLIHKIPLRAYIGICHTKQKVASFGSITYFDYSQRKFLSQSLLQYKNQFGLLLEKDYHKNNKYQGIEFSFFIETQKNSSFSISKVILLLLDYRGIYQTHNNSIRSDSTKSIQQEQLLQQIRKQQHISHNTIGYSEDFLLQLASYSYGSFPYIGLSNKNNNQWKLNEFFNDLPEVPSLIFDYSIIYIGIPAFSSEERKKESISSELKDKLETLYKHDLPIHQSILYKNICQGKDFSNQTEVLKSQYALQFLDCVHRLFSPLHSEQELQNFLYLIQKRQLIDELKNDISPELSNYIHQIKSFFLNYHNATTRYRIDPTNSGGSIMLITPIERFRKVINHHIDIETPSLHDNSYVIYKSWEDGIEEKGLFIEQDVHQGLFSDYVRKGYIKISNEHNSVKRSSDLLTHEYPVIIDMIKKKIFIYGNSINSKDLPSQSYTTELLYILIKNLGNPIENKSLPLSAYSKNKNEMVGKIIVPLKKIIKKYFSGDFPLHCRGKGSDFSVLLEKDPIGMSLVEEVL